MSRAICFSSFSGSHSSSLSWKATHSPRAAPMPVLRAAEAPRFAAWRISRIRGSAISAASAAVASVEQSSTTISSNSVKLWRSTLSMAPRIAPARL